MKNKMTISLTAFLLFALLCGFAGIDTQQNKISVNTGQVRDITSTSAVGRYTLTFTGIPITSHGICLSLKPGPTTANTIYHGDKSRGPAFDVQLTGLRPGVKFYIRGFVTDKAGVTVYGNEVSFSTTNSK